MASGTAMDKKVGQPLIAWSVFLLLVVVVTAGEYFNSFEEFQMSKMAVAVIGVMFVVLLWAGIWALVGKVVTHSPGFLPTTDPESFWQENMRLVKEEE